jgi:hypothetical protein
VTLRFDVNDQDLRASFLGRSMLDALQPLGLEERASWSRMTAQQRVEYLVWTFELSRGLGHVVCPTPEADRARLKRFLYSNRPSPPEFMNPALAAGLPPLRHPGLAEAKAALRVEVSRFLEESNAAPGRLITHPIFGPIHGEEWARTHYKHGFHHLQQFGLLDVEPEPAENRPR